MFIKLSVKEISCTLEMKNLHHACAVMEEGNVTKQFTEALF